MFELDLATGEGHNQATFLLGSYRKHEPQFTENKYNATAHHGLIPGQHGATVVTVLLDMSVFLFALLFN